MASKFIILLLVAFAVSKACDLDLILEDLYDDSESEEDDKPSPAQNSTEKPPNSPTTAKIPTAPPPNEQPTPVPFNTTSNDNSTQARSLGKHRRHSVHHHRYLIRRLPLESKSSEDAPIEGRDLHSLLHEIPYPARYAPNYHGARSVNYKSEELEDILDLVDRINKNDREVDEVEAEGRSVLITPAEDESEVEVEAEGRNESVNEEDNDEERSASGGHHKKMKIDGSFIIHGLSSRFKGHKTPSKTHPTHKHSPIRHVYRYVPSKHPDKYKDHPSTIEVFVINNYPNKVQNINQNPTNAENKTVSKPSNMMTKTPLGRPFITKLDDELILETKPQDSNSPCASAEVNRIKEHTVHETVKINPVDHSEVRNIEEKLTYTVIKSPCGAPDKSNSEGQVPPLSEAIAHIELPEIPEQVKGSAGQKMKEKWQQALPLLNSRVPDFHQDLDKNRKGSVNEHSEDHIAQKSPSTLHINTEGIPIEETNIYVDPHRHQDEHMSHSYPTLQDYNVYGSMPNYPINNPSVGYHPEDHQNKPVMEHEGQMQEHRDHLSQEHHQEPAHHHQVMNATAPVPPKVINVV